jgi:hypothetical protein
MLKDLRTTVSGLVLALLTAAIVIAALFTRPQWGPAEIALLVGGVGAAMGTAALGIVARDPAKGPPGAPTVPPIIGGLLLGIGVGLLVVAAPLSLAGCTPAAQATAAHVGGTALAAIDGPACELVEVRSGAALAGVLCSAAAGALEGLLADASKLASSDAVPRARVVAAPAARCRLVPVRVSGSHQGFACEEHASTLVAALARDGGA